MKNRLLLSLVLLALGLPMPYPSFAFIPIEAGKQTKTSVEKPIQPSKKKAKKAKRFKFFKKSLKQQTKTSKGRYYTAAFFVFLLAAFTIFASLYLYILWEQIIMISLAPPIFGLFLIYWAIRLIQMGIKPPLEGQGPKAWMYSLVLLASLAVFASMAYVLGMAGLFSSTYINVSAALVGFIIPSIIGLVTSVYLILKIVRVAKATRQAKQNTTPE